MRGDEPGLVLVLGGTADANALVRLLRQRAPDLPMVLSLAGRTSKPNLPDGIPVRVGGFGGADGLAAYLEAQGVQTLIDATHPFAVGISHNARRAAETANIARFRLCRMPWRPVSGDRWQIVRDEVEAVACLPQAARPFIALGSQRLAALASRPDLQPILRMIEAPVPPLGFDAEILLGRPSSSADDEARLLAELHVSHLVSRNSGGLESYAKIEAARLLGINVVMIERPAHGEDPAVNHSVETVADRVIHSARVTTSRRA